MKKDAFFILTLSSILIFILTESAFTQIPDYPVFKPGRVVIKLPPHVSPIPHQRGIVDLGHDSLNQIAERYHFDTISLHFQTNPPPHRMDLPDLSRIYRVTFPDYYNVHEVAQSLANDANVEYAEAVPQAYLYDEPNDPRYSQQTFLTHLQAPAAWDIHHGEDGAESVLVGVVDTGVDYTHPDLAANIWTNPGEIPDNGLDDDQNGYIDDWRGYDLADDDHDPMDVYDHGTHCAGLAAGVTDNNEGIASISWNVQILPVKIFDQYLDNEYQGIVYAAEMGADVITNSWGELSYSRANEEAIAYAAGLGSVIFAAAGNLNNETRSYPAGYARVISVAALEINDIKASFSSYSMTVDVAAPGVDLLSTVIGGGYALYSGTSMATPVAAGLAALLKSYHPDWSPSQIAWQLLASADDISTQNPNYDGLLGSGRINAYRALSEEIAEPGFPLRLELNHIAIVDPDGDGFPEHGEQVAVSVKIQNFALTETENCQLTLTTADSDVAILDGDHTGYLGGDQITTFDEVFLVEIEPEAAGHTVQFQLQINTEVAIQGDSIFNFDLEIGRTPILYVADDYDRHPNRDYYTATLDEIGIPYSRWDHTLRGTPPTEYMDWFQTVIWGVSGVIYNNPTEGSFVTLNAEDRAQLTSFLQNGGHLYMAGQDIAWDLCNPTGTANGLPNQYIQSEGESQGFFLGYLHANYINTNSFSDYLTGVPGDPLGDGLEFGIYHPQFSSGEQHPDLILAHGPATPAFHYETHLPGCIRYDGGHRVVYSAFGLEAVGGSWNLDPQQSIPERTEFLARTIDWLNWIEHTPLPDTEVLDQPYDVAVYLGEFYMDINSVTLFWKNETMAEFSEVTLTQDEPGNFYLGEIPAALTANRIEYYLEINREYYTQTEPARAPERTYSFSAGPDQEPPQIIAIGCAPDLLDTRISSPISVEVIDNIGIGQVTVRFGTDGEFTMDFQLINNPGSPIYTGDFPAGWAFGDQIQYFIEVVDSSSNQNTTLSDTLSYRVGFEGFEYGLDFWMVNPDEWGQSTTHHSGEFSLNTFPNGPYPDNYESAIISHPLDFSAVNATERLTLSFWHKHVLEPNNDLVSIELSADGDNWTTYGDPITGVHHSWDEWSADISEFRGESAVHLRFRLVTNESLSFNGWFVDDIQIEARPFTAIADDPAPFVSARPILQQNFPNPLRMADGQRETVIAYYVPRPSRVCLNIYDAAGRLVKALIEREQTPGWQQASWNGQNENSEAVSSGIYFYQLQTSGETVTRKCLLLK